MYMKQVKAVIFSAVNRHCTLQSHCTPCSYKLCVTVKLRNSSLVLGCDMDVQCNTGAVVLIVVERGYSRCGTAVVWLVWPCCIAQCDSIRRLL